MKKTNNLNSERRVNKRLFGVSKTNSQLYKLRLKKFEETILSIYRHHIPVPPGFGVFLL
jgi:hypothetical protein